MRIFYFFENRIFSHYVSPRIFLYFLFLQKKKIRKEGILRSILSLYFFKKILKILKNVTISKHVTNYTCSKKRRAVAKKYFSCFVPTTKFFLKCFAYLLFFQKPYNWVRLLIFLKGYIFLKEDIF